MKHEILQMLKNGGGAIVNTSSAGSVMGIPQLPIYVASKHVALHVHDKGRYKNRAKYRIMKK
jgi:short-subunit dehydrogenase